MTLSFENPSEEKMRFEEFNREREEKLHMRREITGYSH
jgi:hypothetical protein